ncbi:MAG: hypothetical protein PHZ26_03430 [Candidatus Gracilibacteria bacterium]|nr:hypothetical protein [Candidatus Gracilibacteria bacterium]MDD2908778.1 hypothetical protein [Candidatus Gracilibacteria bacterium]
MKQNIIKKNITLELSRDEIKSIIDRMANYEFNQLLLIELIKYEFIVNSPYKDHFLGLSIHEQTFFVKSIIFIIKQNSYLPSNKKEEIEIYSFKYNSSGEDSKNKENNKLNGINNTSHELNLNIWNKICTYKNIDISGIFSFKFNYIGKYIYDSSFKNSRKYFFEGKIKYKHLSNVFNKNKEIKNILINNYV